MLWQSGREGSLSEYDAVVAFTQALFPVQLSWLSENILARVERAWDFYAIF